MFHWSTTFQKARVTPVIHIQMGEKGVVKKSKNSLKSLTKRQKITLAGVGAGILLLGILVLIACLLPKEEKGRLNVLQVKDSVESSPESSRRNKPGLSGRAGKTLGARALVSKPPLPSDLHDETEVVAEYNEALGMTEEPQKKTSEETTKVNAQIKETKVVPPIAPVKESKKTIEKTHNVDPNESTNLTPQIKETAPVNESQEKQPTVSLKTVRIMRVLWLKP